MCPDFIHRLESDADNVSADSVVFLALAALSLVARSLTEATFDAVIVPSAHARDQNALVFGGQVVGCDELTRFGCGVRMAEFEVRSLSENDGEVSNWARRRDWPVVLVELDASMALLHEDSLRSGGLNVLSKDLVVGVCDGEESCNKFHS